MNIGNFNVDAEAEVNGITKDLGGGASILVARADNVNYNNLLRTETAPYRTVLGLTGLTDDEADALVVRVLARTVLLGWEGLTDEEGKTVPYSFDTAVDWLTRYPEFRKLVIGVASDVNNYRNAKADEVKDNIKK